MGSNNNNNINKEMEHSSPCSDRLAVGDRGVSKGFLDQLVREIGETIQPAEFVHGAHGDMYRFDPTADRLSVRALTLCSGRSLVETLCLASQLSGDVWFIEGDGKAYFGRARTFISYGWRGTTIFNLVGSLPDDSDDYFWIDVFAVAQNRGNSELDRNNLDDVQSFEKVVEGTEATALLWNPWECPSPLNRVWCLYEVLVTVRLSHKLRVLFRRCDLAAVKLAAQTVEGRARIRAQLQTLRSVLADATMVGDWYNIHCMIEEELNPQIPSGKKVQRDKNGIPTLQSFPMGPDDDRFSVVLSFMADSRECFGSSAGHAVLDELVQRALLDTLERALGVSLREARSVICTDQSVPFAQSSLSDRICFVSLHGAIIAVSSAHGIWAANVSSPPLDWAELELGISDDAQAIRQAEDELAPGDSFCSGDRFAKRGYWPRACAVAASQEPATSSCSSFAVGAPDGSVSLVDDQFGITGKLDCNTLEISAAAALCGFAANAAATDVWFDECNRLWGGACENKLLPPQMPDGCVREPDFKLAVSQALRRPVKALAAADGYLYALHGLAYGQRADGPLHLAATVPKDLQTQVQTSETPGLWRVYVLSVWSLDTKVCRDHHVLEALGDEPSLGLGRHAGNEVVGEIVVQGSRLCVSLGGKELKIFDFVNGKLEPLPPHQLTGWVSAITAASGQLLCGRTDGQIDILGLYGESRASVSYHTTTITSIAAFKADEQRALPLVASASDSRVLIWELDSCLLLHSLHHDYPVHTMVPCVIDGRHGLLSLQQSGLADAQLRDKGSISNSLLVWQLPVPEQSE